MPLRNVPLYAVCAATLLFVAAPAARATTFSSLIVYGDSLSDDGNLYHLDGGIDPASPPYYDGRFSNGPVAAEQLAGLLGVPLFDFAVGGATSGVGNYGDGGTQTTLGAYGLPGMQAELAASASLLTPAVTASSLFLVWGGANDFISGGSPTVAAADIVGIVETLQAAGATNILVPGIPDLGLTPDYYGDPAATAYSQAFNAALQAELPAGATYFDTSALLDEIEDDPSAYGLTDLNTPCLVGSTPCSDPSQYLFWDGFHPTTTIDTIVAESFEEAVNPTPEPSSLLLLGTGAAGVFGLVRRRIGH